MSLDALMKIVSIVAEYLIILYYCDSTLEYKHSRHRSICLVTLGYAGYYVICLFENMAVNICGFVIINFILIYFGYKTSITNAVIKVIILTVFMMFSELIVSLLINTELNNNFSDIATAAENVIFSLSSKLLYFSMIVIFKHVSGNGEHRYKAKEMISLIVLPISTCLFLSLFNQIRGSLAARVEILFVIFSIMLIISNFIVYIVCERIIENNIQIQDLKQVEYKRAIDEKSYRLIKEKYDELRILVHDFDKYCNHIEAMTAGGGRDVRAVTRQIKIKTRNF